MTRFNAYTITPQSRTLTHMFLCVFIVTTTKCLSIFWASDFSDSSDDGEDTHLEDISISDFDTSDVDDDDTSDHPLQPLETEWSTSLDQTPLFLCDVGPSYNLQQSDTERDFLKLIFDDRCNHVLTEGTNTVNVLYLACTIIGEISIFGYLAWIWIGVLF